MATVQLTKDNFEPTIAGNSMVIVDFWAPWCGPCRSFAPIFDAASEKYPEIVFAKVNTDEEQELAAKFQIRSIPTLMILREQVILFSQPGALHASALENIIEQARAVDMARVHEEIRKEQPVSH
ncbi:MAG TPA: thioredoxin [Burkholderiales bacterium]|nr:thioredoxin [Burkholderiales bacterium]